MTRRRWTGWPVCTPSSTRPPTPGRGPPLRAGADAPLAPRPVAVAARLAPAGANSVPSAPAVASPPGVSTPADPYDAARGADVLAILTEWPQFAELDYHK